MVKLSMQLLSFVQGLSKLSMLCMHTMLFIKSMSKKLAKHVEKAKTINKNVEIILTPCRFPNSPSDTDLLEPPSILLSHLS